jgi:hypothetical protein
MPSSAKTASASKASSKPAAKKDDTVSKSAHSKAVGRVRNLEAEVDEIWYVLATNFGVGKPSDAQAAAAEESEAAAKAIEEAEKAAA